MEPDMPAARVHIASAAPGVLTPPAPACERPATVRTIQLDTENPVMPLLARELTRSCALVHAITNDVLICKTKGDALIGEGATLPHADTCFTPLDTTDELWVTAPVLPAQVSLIMISET